MTNDCKDTCACPTYGAPGVFGYRDAAGVLVWYCERHRLAQFWADARRDATERTAFDLAIPNHLKQAIEPAIEKEDGQSEKTL
jgi:hypothetical protein